MTLSRKGSSFSFGSSLSGTAYTFDIVQDAQGLFSVSNIQSPYGPISSTTPLPQWALIDIQRAMETVLVLQGETEAYSSTILFEGETSKTALIPADTLDNTNYRVSLTSSDGTILSISDKTTTSFEVSASSAYGSVDDPLTVSFSVLTKTAQTSDLSGNLIFAHPDFPETTVTFSSPLESANYRVMLEQVPQTLAWVKEKTKTNFTVSLSHDLEVGSTIIIGYDLFV